MVNLNGIDASTVDPVGEYEPLPAGKYLAIITDSGMRPTKSGKGEYLHLTFQVFDGPYKGRLLWSRLNLRNPNALTVQIAQGELSAICRAVGVMRPADSVELHNLPLQITVKCKRLEESGDIVNEVRGYAKRPTAAEQPQPEQGSTPPWSRQ